MHSIQQPQPDGNAAGRNDDALLTHLAVRTVLERYLSSVDRCDWIAFGECFSEDAVAVFNHGAPNQLSGREAIVAKVQVVARFHATSHALSNIDVRAAGNAAIACTQAIAHLVLGPPEAGVPILVRGIRYDDELTCVDGVWRIRRHIHMPLWQYQFPAMSPSY